MFDKVKIAKLFANSDPLLRGKAYKSVKGILKRPFGEGKEGLNSKEILGIWKGLFEWLKCQDKMLLQEEVVSKISLLLIDEIKHDDVALEFIKSYSLTMQREWNSLGTLLKDKFMMLVREINNSIFKWLKKTSWNQWNVVISCLVNEKVSVTSINLCIHMVETLIDESEELTVDLRTQLVIHIYKWAAANKIEPNLIMSKISQYILKKVTSEKFKVNTKDISKNLFTLAKMPNISAGKRKCFYHYLKRFNQQKGYINSDDISESNPIVSNDLSDQPYNKDNDVGTEIEESVKTLQAKSKKKKHKKKRVIENTDSEHVTNDVEMVDVESLKESDESLQIKKNKKNSKSTEIQKPLESQNKSAHQTESLCDKMSSATTSSVKSKFIKNLKADKDYTKLKSVSFGKVYKKKITPSMMIKSFSNGSIDSLDKEFIENKPILKKKIQKKIVKK